MRAALVSLITLSFAAPVLAQTMPDSTAPAVAPMPPSAPSATPAPMSPSPSAPTPTPPAMTVPDITAPSATSPTPSTTGATTVPPSMAPTEAAPTPPPPPAPPPAPTDPTAISLISTLESVCIPAVGGGNMDKLAKAAGYHKSGDNYVMRGKTFQLTVLAPGSNPTTCHVDIVSPVDPEAPAKPLVVSLHNWAAVTRGYTLYRNDKNVAASQELTTRSWEINEGGKNQALVLTTFRKADGTAGSRETSQMLFSTTATAAN